MRTYCLSICPAILADNCGRCAACKAPARTPCEHCNAAWKTAPVADPKVVQHVVRDGVVAQ